MTTNNRTIRLILVLAIMAAAQCISAAVTASSVMETMRTKITQAKNIEILFTMYNGPKPLQGNAYMSGTRFVFETPLLNVWYDGRTQWTLMRTTGEVSITEPDAEELTTTNPFAILNDYTKLYNARLLADTGGCHRVELTPKTKNSGIKRITINASIKTGYPSEVELCFSDGRTVRLIVDSINAAAARPQTVFTFDKKKFPSAEIIDLR